jgi:hypothetical protein
VTPYIRSARVEEIIGQAFSCHKTTTCKGRSNDHPDAQHCAGSLILHEKMKRPHLAMILGKHLGLYDPSKLNMDAPVYESAAAMIAAHRAEEQKSYTYTKPQTTTP